MQDSSQIHFSKSFSAFSALCMHEKAASAYFIEIALPFSWVLGFLISKYTKFPNVACNFSCKSCKDATIMMTATATLHGVIHCMLQLLFKHSLITNMQTQLQVVAVLLVAVARQVPDPHDVISYCSCS